MKKLIIVYPPGTSKTHVDNMCSLFRGANPETSVGRKLDKSAKYVSLLIIDKRRGVGG